MNHDLNHLLWIDLEMTGLDPEINVIIEVAAILTKAEFPFEAIDQYHVVVRQHKEHLDRMDKWNTNVHRASGLCDLIPNGKTETEAEDGLIQWVTPYTKDEPLVIAGNSISQDRSFIKKYFHKLEAKLHYRMLDVTAWKILLEKQGISFEKKNQHRALSDIQESIAEMKFYMSYLNQEKIKKDKGAF